MSTPRFLRRWLRLPSRVALILGLGALPTTGAQAHAPDQSSLGSFGDISIRSEGGRIYLSEADGKFQELELKDTAEARHLKQILQENEAAAGSGGLRLTPTILAGGGGTGFFWWETKKPATEKPAPTRQEPSQVTAPPSSTYQGSAPRQHDLAAGKKG